MKRCLKAHKELRRLVAEPAMPRWQAMVQNVAEERGERIDGGASFRLRAGVSIEAIVSYILQAAQDSPDFDTIQRRLMHDFSLEADEAITAMDRTLAGVVHASGGDPHWCPDPAVRDPIAWQSYQMACADHSIIEAIYPRLL